MLLHNNNTISFIEPSTLGSHTQLLLHYLGVAVAGFDDLLIVIVFLDVASALLCNDDDEVIVPFDLNDHCILE